MNSALPPQVTKILAALDRSTAGFRPLNFFESQTGLPRSYAVVAGAVFYFIAIFLNLGGIGQLLSNFAGFVVPGYYSLLALETTSTADDTALLTYWVVFAFLNVIEYWSRAILYWVPFYFLFKTIFLLYIGIPSFGGAQLVYVNFIKPFARTYIVKNKSLTRKVDEVAAAVSSSVEL